MASTQYSTSCYYKNDLYRVSIVVDQDGDSDGDSEISEQFTGTDLSPDKIKPTLTHLHFELADPHRKSSALPKTIRLNQLLNVVYVKSVSNRQQKHAFTSVDTMNSPDPSRDAMEKSQETLSTMLNKSRSEMNVAQPPARNQQFSWGTFLSRQTTINGSRTDLIRRSAIRLCYVDVSNSIQWHVKKLELELETETMAVDLYRNLNLCLSTLVERPRYLLVFVNPCCGKGNWKGTRWNCWQMKMKGSEA